MASVDLVYIDINNARMTTIFFQERQTVAGRNSILTWRPFHLSSTKYMQMKMVDRLTYIINKKLKFSNLAIRKVASFCASSIKAFKVISYKLEKSLRAFVNLVFVAFVVQKNFPLNILYTYMLPN